MSKQAIHRSLRAIVPLIPSTLTAVALLSGTLAGCEADVNPTDQQREIDEIDEIDEIVANLLAADYPASEIEVADDGSVIVGGDAVVSLEASREIAGTAAVNHEGFRQYRTTNLVTVDNICIDGSVLTGNASTALDRAIDNYNDEGLQFWLERTSGSTSGCDSVITFEMQNGTSAQAGFPSNGEPYHTIKLGDDIQGFNVLTHVIMHEIGHCVGFRHTDYYNRSISCNEGGDEGQGTMGAHHIPNTPTTASYNGSVMNSCYNSGVSGEWTDSDIDALVTLYADFCQRYGGEEVALETVHGRYVRAGEAGGGWEVDQQTSIGNWEKFTVGCVLDEISLKSSHGRYLRARNSSNGYDVDQESAFFPNGNNLFNALLQDDGSWAFRTNADNRYLRAGNANGDWTITQQTYIGSYEKFIVIPQ